MSQQYHLESVVFNVCQAAGGRDGQMTPRQFVACMFSESVSRVHWFSNLQLSLFLNNPLLKHALSWFESDCVCVCVRLAGIFVSVCKSFVRICAGLHLCST